MDNWLNYHHLYYFRTIATEGSIAQAAKKLRLGQPTLSAQLKQFEEKLGISLFERQHKKLTLTETGRIALEYATEIFRMGSEMVEAMHDRLTPTRTHLTLGALDSVPKHLIYKLIHSAYRIAPCTVTIREGSDEELAIELMSHRIDILLTNHLPNVSDGKKLHSKLLAKYPVIVCGSDKFKHLKKGFPQSLNQCPMVLPTKHSKLRYDLDYFFQINKISPDIVAETQDTSMQKLLGSKSIGAFPIADIAVENMLKNKDLLSLGTIHGLYEEFYLVSSSRKIANPIAVQLIEKFII